MTFEEFKASLSQTAPPSGMTPALQALWEDAQGRWDQAHKIVQATSDWTGAWVHAYLHRKEGDIANALYWYSHAGKSQPRLSLEEEWEFLVKALLSS